MQGENANHLSNNGSRSKDKPGEFELTAGIQRLLLLRYI
jgi:hypothetical protein